MPPKAKITKDMILDAAFYVARTSGWENINARTVAGYLNCSTQPVMYHFATIEELKQAVYTKADQFHSEYLMQITNPEQDILLCIGLNYIRFAVEEPHLFRFLFQSGLASGTSLPEMIDAPELLPLLSVIQQALALNMEQTKDVFLTLAMFAHGYASIITNNALEFDEEIVAAHLTRTFHGAILAVQEKNHEKDI